MNSREKEEIAKQLENTRLSGAEVKGRSLLRKCCDQRMIIIGSNHGVKEKLAYCSQCRRSYDTSLASFFRPDYVSGFS